MNDAELVCQVLQGNRGAYVDLLKRYTPQIAALCRAHIPRPDVVDDLVQETFLRGLDRLCDLRDPAKFGYWLYAIARNASRDWLNDPHHKQASLDSVALASATAEPDDYHDRPDRTADLKACVRRLPVELREVVEIYYWGGRVTYQEMADRLGVSFGQVNRLLTKARKMLRDSLENDEDTSKRDSANTRRHGSR